MRCLGIPWSTAYLIVFALVTILTVAFIDGRRWQLLSFASLAILGLVASDFNRIGEQYMPPLDEGSILDMPISVPRMSVTEAADDLKARDAMLRQFPEVEQVVGKAGRAETPTDPAPLDMVETVVNLRPKDFWPKRQLRYADAMAQTKVVLDALESRKLISAPTDRAERQALINDATMGATAQLDQSLRRLIVERYAEFEKRLAMQLTREFIAELVANWRKSGQLLQPVSDARFDQLTKQYSATLGPWLAAGAAQEDVNLLIRQVAESLGQEKTIDLRDPMLMDLPRGPIGKVWSAIVEQLGIEPPTLFTSMRAYIQQRREIAWSDLVKKLNYEVFDQAVGSFDWYCIEELRKEAAERASAGHPASAANAGARQIDTKIAELQSLRADLDKPFGRGLLLWQKTKDDVVKEMDSTIQVPGWSNIFTQPIINRIDMLATGVRTMIGVKVFGTDLDRIQAVSQEVAEVLRTVPGALNVVADQIVGKGYLDITIDRATCGTLWRQCRRRAGCHRSGTGRQADHGHRRWPRASSGANSLCRNARAGEEQIKNLLISAAGTSGGSAGDSSMGASTAKAAGPTTRPLQVPLASVADVRIVEGPSEIKSENGMLRSYVQLNVSTPDLVGFVEQAQRQVEQKVKLPTGMHLEWSGQFEHKLRADRTMRWIMPLVLILIFVILYLTYNDFMDAVLMMMAVPEALVGGVFFLWLTGHSYSVAVQVGFIACFGMATETGIIMLVYLRESIERRGGLEEIKSLEELKQAVVDGAVHRLRPKLLTEGVAIVALGADALGFRRGTRSAIGDGGARARRAVGVGRSGRFILAGAVFLGSPVSLAAATCRRSGTKVVRAGPRRERKRPFTFVAHSGTMKSGRVEPRQFCRADNKSRNREQSKGRIP